MDTATLQALDDFLTSDRAPENSMQLSDLDGFLTGVAVNPKPISRAELLPVVWGEDEPAFADNEEAEWIINAILDRYDEIAEMLSDAPDELSPILLEDPEGEPVAEDWAAGFVEAVVMCADDWRPLFDNNDTFLALAPIIIVGQDLESLKDMGVDADTKSQVCHELPNVLTACLVRMRDFFSQHAGLHDNDNTLPTRH